MTNILVGIDGSERSERALEWAARRASREAGSITLLSVIDPASVHAVNGNKKILVNAAEATLYAQQRIVAERYPAVQTSTQVVMGKIVESLVDAASGCDMVVLGSHHGATISDAIGAAKGLRVSVLADVPTVLVPADWDFRAAGEGIVVGVGPDDSSSGAVIFGVNEALESGQELTLVSAWGLPALLERSAEAMGGGLSPIGEQYQRELDQRVRALKEEHPTLQVAGRSVEGSSPTRVLLDCSAGNALLVLGTHARNAFGRTLFGSVTHGTLLKLVVPTVVVPQA